MSEELLSAATTEYQALREEISRRSVAQGTLVAAAPTVGGLAITVGAATQQNILVSILVPVLSVSFGLLWLDHAQQIENLGAHIQKFLEPVLRRLAGDEKVMTWEQRGQVVRDKSDQDSIGLAERMAYPILFVFIAPAALASFQGAFTAFAAYRSSGALSVTMISAIIALGLVIEIFFAARWRRVIRGLSGVRED